jgi:eukaryotic-like serine/threonine-protein kinase
MDRLPGYALSHLLGRGVYSEVFEATHVDRPGSPLAVKLLKPQFHDDDWVVQCFQREGAIAAAVRHPALLHVFESHDTPLAHVCPRIAGSTLRDTGPIPLDMVIDVLTPVAAGLSALHRAGFVHGDVKPGNILCDTSRRAVLIDLGFARRPGSLSFADGLPGTPNYLAPELCRRAALDTPAADVFALGVTAFELLTGEHPYPALDDCAEVLAQHRDEPPHSLRGIKNTWPESLVGLIDRMLAVNVFERPKASRIVAELSMLQTMPAAHAA